MAQDVFPLGFHAGTTGHFPAHLIRTINEKGKKAFVKVVDSDGRAEEALHIGDSFGIENVSVFRVSKHRRGVETEAPDELFVQGRSMEEAADMWWERHHRQFQEINNARTRNGGREMDRRIWFELANETNRNTYRQQGEMFAIIATKYALPGGWRICAPGSNSGEPESWEGWEEYFKLCALHPDKIAVAIHYYEWRIGDSQHNDVRFRDSVPHLVGREEKIYEICDQLNINYPVIHVTEGGFKHDMLPGWNPQVDEWVEGVSRHIGEQPNMTGIAWWCAQRYQGNIHHTFNNDYVPQFQNKARNWVAPPQKSWGDRPDPVTGGGSGSGSSGSSAWGSQGGGNTGGGSQSGSGGSAGGSTQAATATNKATGALAGIEATRFGLGHEGHENLFRVNKSNWFHFEFRNTTGRDIAYGGLGVMAWRWHGGKWSKFQWQNSFGGFAHDKLAPNQILKHGDHITLSEQGIFALSLSATSDRDALHKVESPDSISDLQPLREPIYVHIKSHFEVGGPVADPPQPLFVAQSGGDGQGGSNAGGNTGTSTGGNSGGGDGGGQSTPGSPWQVTRQQATYLLAPQSLTAGERRELYQLAWDGVTLANGQKTSGKHTVTFSHDDAFNNVVRGAAGSMVIIVEPQRIGTGITADWMAQNAANVTFELLRLDGVNVGFGLGRGGTNEGSEGDESGGNSGGAANQDASMDDDFIEGWIFNRELDVDESTTPPTITVGSTKNVRNGPSVERFPDALGQVLQGVKVEKIGDLEEGYFKVRIRKGSLTPIGGSSSGGNAGGNTGGSVDGRPITPGRYSGPDVTFVAGIHGPGDAHTWHQGGFRGMMQNLDIPVKFMSDGDRANWYGSFNRQELSLVRVFWKPDFSRKKTAQQAWNEDIRDGVMRFYNKGARDFEVLNEPRLHHEGMGHQWHNGAEFGDFLFDLMKIIQRECPNSRLWYPGESPGVPWTNQFIFSRPAFKKVSSLCYGVCMHAYSGNTSNAEVAAAEIVDQAKAFRRGLAHGNMNPAAWRMPLIISECSVNRAPQNAGREFAEYRAEVYKRVTTGLKNVPGMKGVFWYISHWNAPPGEVANQESWWHTDLPDLYKRKMQS